MMYTSSSSITLHKREYTVLSTIGIMNSPVHPSRTGNNGGFTFRLTLGIIPDPNLVYVFFYHNLL